MSISKQVGLAVCPCSGGRRCCRALALSDWRVHVRHCNSVFPGCSASFIFSPFAAAVCSGRSCITRPTRNGRSSCAGSSRISRCFFALCFIFAIPILLLRHHLFEWMNIAPGANPVLDSKRQYLNWPFFAFRAFLYFALLGGVAFFLRRFSVRQDRDGNPRCTIWMRKVAFAGLPHLWSGAHLRRFRLVDGTELSLVLHHVGPVHFCRRGRQLDVAARARDYRVAPGRLPEEW